MKPNREQIAALLAALILIFGAREILLGLFTPTSAVVPVDAEVSKSTRDVVPRRYRTFTVTDVSLRDPFVFAEGWQALEVLPMPAPPLPPPARLVPAPLALASASSSPLWFEEETPRRSRTADDDPRATTTPQEER